MIVVGIDPGRETGLIALDVPGSQLQYATWLRHTVMRPSESIRFTHPERDFNFSQRLKGWLEEIGPDLVVLEEPYNAAENWSSQRAGRPQARGTSFRLGAYYQAAVTAAGLAVPAGRMVSYPPTTHGHRRGWMRNCKRATVLRDSALMARALRAPLEVYETSQNAKEPGYANGHLLMALGVVMFHWSTHRNPLAVEGVA